MLFASDALGQEPNKLDGRIQEALVNFVPAPPPTPTLPPPPARATGWDQATEARNRWLYEECMRVTPYKRIIKDLEKRSASENWELIKTINGIKSAAARYAERTRLPLPPERHPGRPTKD
jgi:hypothetical protein